MPYRREFVTSFETADDREAQLVHQQRFFGIVTSHLNGAENLEDGEMLLCSEEANSDGQVVWAQRTERGMVRAVVGTDLMKPDWQIELRIIQGERGQDEYEFVYADLNGEWPKTAKELTGRERPVTLRDLAKTRPFFNKSASVFDADSLPILNQSKEGWAAYAKEMGEKDEAARRAEERRLKREYEEVMSRPTSTWTLNDQGTVDSYRFRREQEANRRKPDPYWGGFGDIPEVKPDQK